jgi:uncharacterized repeat protein (TIGR01451 family)
MRREAAKGLVVAVEAALLLLLFGMAVALPLRAAPSSHPSVVQPDETVTLDISSAPSATVTAGQSLVLTATVRNRNEITATGVGLTFTLPGALSQEVTRDQLEQSWPHIAVEETKTHSLTLSIPEQISGTLWFTANLRYTHATTPGVSIPIRAIRSVQVITVPSEPAAPPEATTPPIIVATEPATSTPVPPTLPTETPTPSISPTIPVTPSPAAPTPSPLLPFLPTDIVESLVENSLWIGGGCLLLLVLILLATIMPLVGRRRRRREELSPPPKPSPPSSAPTAPHLESVRTPDGPRRFGLEPEGITIGRTPENDLVITQDFPHWETVSRQHARIYRRADRWVVEDLNSMNGVYVNGRRTGRNLLHNGWQLDIGGVEFVFRGGTGEAGQ